MSFLYDVCHKEHLTTPFLSEARNGETKWHLMTNVSWCHNMTQEIKSHQFLSKIADNTDKFVEISEQVDKVCQYCEPISPMICVEQCEIWRTKNEFLQLNGTLCADDYVYDLLNAVKNDRRRKIIEALFKRPRSIKELQEYLKRKGYYHSQPTIASTYVEPLVKAGLIQRDGDMHRLTLYGRKFKDVLSKFDVEDLLPSHSHCYEEIVLRELKDEPKTHSDLARSVPQNILSRTIQRLKEKGLVAKSESSEYIFYFRTKKVPKKSFSPTEKKVYEAIPEVGASARQLSEKVGISLRRTYKYLRRLRNRKLVFTRERPRAYKLTSSGKEAADFLEETANLVLDASRASTFLLERPRQATIEPGSLCLICGSSAVRTSRSFY